MREPCSIRPLQHQWQARLSLKAVAASLRPDGRDVLAAVLDDIAEEIIGDYRQRKIVPRRREHD